MIYNDLYTVYPLNMVIFHSYAKLPKGIFSFQVGTLRPSRPEKSTKELFERIKLFVHEAKHTSQRRDPVAPPKKWLPSGYVKIAIENCHL